MKLTNFQSSLMAAMPEHSRRVVLNRIKATLESRMVVNDAGFCMAVEMVFWADPVPPNCRHAMRRLWRSLGGGRDGVVIWALMERYKAGLRYVLELVEFWEGEQEEEQRWADMLVAIERGATQQVMKALFQCRPAEYLDLRKLVCASPCRKKLLSELEDISLFRLWQVCGKPGADAFDELVTLSKNTGYSLDLIWPCVQEWIAVEQSFAEKQRIGVER